MKTKRYLTDFKSTLGFLLITANAYGGLKPHQHQITNADKTEIIRRTLESELLGQKPHGVHEITDFDLLMRAKGGVVLSSRHLKRKLVPHIPQAKLLVLSPQEIQAKANREGDFLYLIFSRFDVDDLKVVVTLKKVWAKSKTSKEDYISGGSVTYEYRREKGKWVKRFVEGYVV
jgi:hypothetical protein